jgi:hypothetical protein
METYKFDDAVFLGVLLNEKVPGAEHPLKQPDCPSIPEFEQLAANTAGWSLKWWLHKNNCPYCQLTLRLFREEMGIQPWWEKWREKAEQTLTLSGMKANEEWVHAAGEKEIVPAALLGATAEPKLVPVEVIAARYTGDQCGRLRIKLEESLRDVKPETPIELVIVTYPENQPLGEFLLPALNSCDEERLKVWLPPDARPAWQKLNEPSNEPRRELPFRLILRPSNEQEVTYHRMECAGRRDLPSPSLNSEGEVARPLRFKEMIYELVPVVRRILGVGQTPGYQRKTARPASGACWQTLG